MVKIQVASRQLQFCRRWRVKRWRKKNIEHIVKHRPRIILQTQAYGPRRRGHDVTARVYSVYLVPGLSSLHMWNIIFYCVDRRSRFYLSFSLVPVSAVSLSMVFCMRWSTKRLLLYCFDFGLTATYAQILLLRCNSLRGIGAFRGRHSRRRRRNVREPWKYNNDNSNSSIWLRIGSMATCIQYIT